jgi:hypothetical protein
VDVWQTRVEELEGRVAAMQAAVAHPPPSALPPPAPELHPSLFLLTFLVGLLLGCCLRPRLARRLFPQ